MAERPSGTTTFLFSDIEGSTRLLRELRERYAHALERHRRVVRDAFARHAGHEVDTQGDAFFYAFARARDAAAAAADAQRALSREQWDGEAIKVRMGIHTAEAQSTGEGYVGLGVHRAARICSAAHGGQVLLSQTTRDLLEESLPEGLSAVDLGEHRLKDLAEPQRLFQLTGADLESTFPPLRTLEGKRTNLPTQSTPLIGRERELAELRLLLERAETRLLTLTGPGGTGKTRLALRAAADLLDDRPDGVFFIPLASIVDPDLILPAIAQTLGVSEAAFQSLSAYLADKRLVLVLDNLEQMRDAAPRIADLLSATRRLQVIATSREPLHLSAEQLYLVPPLGLPDPHRPVNVDELARCDALALFVARARAVEPRFALTPANARTLAEICHRLDGLPLAIELAAARVRLLAPEAMLARLGERLSLLTSGARDLPERLRTLRGAIAWSYDLLDAPEQRIVAHLAVFAGSWTIEAAEPVTGAGPDELASLIDKSLIRQTEGRFSMLETIREFALERLEAADDVEDVRRRHAEHFLKLAEDAYDNRLSDEQGWSARLEADHDNLRAALDFLHRRDAAAERRLAGALGWFYHAHSHLSEGRTRVERTLDHELDHSFASARALTAAGALAGDQGDIATAKDRLERAIELWRALGAPVDRALALESLAWAHLMVNDNQPALLRAEEMLAIVRRERPALRTRAQVLAVWAMVATKDCDRAERLAREVLAAAVPQGDIFAEHFARHYLGDCALIGGDPGAALPHYRRSLETAVTLGNVFEITAEIQGIAMAAAGIGQYRKALRISAAADAVQRSLGVDVSGVTFWIELLDRYLGPARAALGPTASDVERAGAQVELGHAVEEALGVRSSDRGADVPVASLGADS